LGVRDLQRQRYEIQRQWSEAHQKELGELKVGLHRSTGIILSLREQRPLPSTSNSSEANVPLKETEGDLLDITSVNTEYKRLKRRCDAISSAAKRQTEFKTRIKAPSWLRFTQTLEFCYSRAAPGWKFSMTAYRVVSDDSELFECVWRGNLIGLRKLFEQKKASPFDKIDFQICTTTILNVSDFIPKIILYLEPKS
jgi:hypothetical protein